MRRHGERHFHVTESGHFSDAETGDCIAERALFTSLCRHESEHNQHSQETARVFENVLTEVWSRRFRIKCKRRRTVGRKYWK